MSREKITEADVTQSGSPFAVTRRAFNRGILGLAGIAAAVEPVMGTTCTEPEARAVRPVVPTPSNAGVEVAPTKYGWSWARDVPMSVRGRNGAIASTRGGKALEDALEVLKHGGNAMDAALSMAVAQVVHAAGSWTSLAGILTLVYYDATTGKVQSLNAGFNTVQNEHDPMTIPVSSFLDPTQPELVTSGRAVLVPGFFAGVQAAHKKFCSVPFATLFNSGIGLAEGGMLVAPDFAEYIDKHKDHFSRLPEAKAVFTKGTGEFYQTGDIFKQPLLAATLRAVAKQGTDYIYKGPWAKKFVAGVQADGGKMTMRDMADYRVDWVDPIHVNYKGYDVYSLHQAHFMHGMLGLAQEGNLSAMGRYYESPQTFYWYHKIFRATGTNMAIMGDRINQLAVPTLDWHDPEKIKRYWQEIQSGTFPGGSTAKKPEHTDVLVVVDKQGNVASLLHSTNTGGTGLFVDGVSIPGPAANQQQHIKNTGPGKPLPNFVPNTIVLKNGKPFIATAAAGVALHQETVKVLTNIIDYGKAGREAVDAPSFIEPHFNVGGPDPGETVLVGDYTEELLDAVRAKGMEIEELPVPIRQKQYQCEASLPNDSSHGGKHGRMAGIGHVVIAVIDQQTGAYEAVSGRWTGAAASF